jgi:ABC-2 type transport system ATP-binding protein
MLSIINFRKVYNGRTILAFHEASFGPGVHWIQGANGAGKSTLFKAISGLIPFEGFITVNGVDIRKHPVEYRLKVNYSEAEPLYPSFVTAKDIFTFIAATKRASPQQKQQLPETWGLQPFFTHAVETFSSGMLKKVSLACAYLGQPSVIILDEPLITLDHDSKNILYESMRHAVAAGTTILMSSHQAINSGEIEPSSKYNVVNATLNRV